MMLSSASPNRTTEHARCSGPVRRLPTGTRTDCQMKRLLSAAVLGLGAMFVTLQPAAAFDPNNKAELEKFIHDYIVSHPEVLLEAQDALQAKQQAAQRDHDKKVIAREQEGNIRRRRRPGPRQPEGRRHGRRALRLQLPLLQARGAGHEGADRRRPRRSVRPQGVPDPRPGFHGGKPRKHCLPDGCARQVQAVPQRVDVQPDEGQRRPRVPDRRQARRQQGNAQGEARAIRRSTPRSSRPIRSPTS